MEFPWFQCVSLCYPKQQIKALIKNIHETWANIGYFLSQLTLAQHSFITTFRKIILCTNDASPQISRSPDKEMWTMASTRHKCLRKCTMHPFHYQQEEQKLCKSYNGKTYQKYRLIWYLNLFYLLVWYKGFQKSWEFNNSWKLWTLSRGFNLTAASFFDSIIDPFSTQLQFPPPTCGSFIGWMSKRIMVSDKKTMNNCTFSLESFLSDP